MLDFPRWKQVAKTSLSSASLQMGRFWPRQKARVHWVHEAEAKGRTLDQMRA